MGYADRVPNRDMMSEHQRVPRVVPILGSTDDHLAAALLARFECAGSRWWAGSGLRRPAVGLAAHHHGPDDAGHLVGQRDRRDLFRLSRQQSHEPRRGAAGLGGADHRGRPNHQQPSQILVAGAADPAELLSPGGRVLARCDADPGGKTPARAKGFGVRYPRFREGRLLSAKLTPPIGPIPGIVAKHRLVCSCRCQVISRASIAFNLMSSPLSWLASTPIISRASTGTSSSLARRASSSVICLGPWAAVTPNSAAWPRIALISIVRCLTSRSRTPSIVSAACCSAVLTGTNRMVGRLIASQIASASIFSFLPRLT